MIVMDKRKIRDEKIKQLKAGCAAYAESNELIRLIQRGIVKNDLSVFDEHTDNGCWFTPVSSNKN